MRVIGFGKTILSLSAMMQFVLGVGAEQFVLNTPNSTLAFESKGSVLMCAYYGARINREEDLFVAGGQLEFPTCWDVANLRNHDEFGYSVIQPDGSLSSQLNYVRAEKVELDADRTRLVFVYEDPAYAVELRRYYEASKSSDVVSTWTELTSSEEGDGHVVGL